MQYRYQLAIQLSHTSPLVLTAWRESLVACWVGLKSLSIYFDVWRRCGHARWFAALIDPSDLLLFRVMLLSGPSLELIVRCLTKHFHCPSFLPDCVVANTRILVFRSRLNVLYVFDELVSRTSMSKVDGVIGKEKNHDICC